MISVEEYKKALEIVNEYNICDHDFGCGKVCKKLDVLKTTSHGQVKYWCFDCHDKIDGDYDE